MRPLATQNNGTASRRRNFDTCCNVSGNRTTQTARRALTIELGRHNTWPARLRRRLRGTLCLAGLRLWTQQGTCSRPAAPTLTARGALGVEFDSARIRPRKQRLCSSFFEPTSFVLGTTIRSSNEPAERAARDVEGLALYRSRREFLRKSGHPLVSFSGVQTRSAACSPGLSVISVCCRNRHTL